MLDIDFGRYNAYFKMMGVAYTILQISDGINFLVSKYGKRMDGPRDEDEKKA